MSLISQTDKWVPPGGGEISCDDLDLTARPSRQHVTRMYPPPGTDRLADGENGDGDRDGVLSQ